MSNLKEKVQYIKQVRADGYGDLCERMLETLTILFNDHKSEIERDGEATFWADSRLKLPSGRRFKFLYSTQGIFNCVANQHGLSAELIHFTEDAVMLKLVLCEKP